MWTVRQVCFQEKEKKCCFVFLFQHGNSKSVTLKSFHALKQVFSPAEVFAMDRFVSKRSSSSVDLDASSLDDVRAERAAIALSVGLSWPPDRYTKQTRGRPSRQQLWERALQDHILEHHELPHGVRLQRPVWWRPREAIDRPLTHEELAHTKTPRAAPATPPAAPVEDEPSGSASKRRKIHVDPHRPRLVPRHAGPVEDRAALGHAAVLAGGPAPLPGNVRRDRQEHALSLPSCLSSLGRSAPTTSHRRMAGPRRRRSCSSWPHWTT